MARPCGCAGECGCTILGGSGITASGAGTTRDPKIISIANPLTGTAAESITAAVGSRLGPGLRYDASTKTLSAKLSGDGGNNLIFGSDNGLYTAGGGGGGGSGGVTVASLSTTDLVGGSFGAGSAQWPEGQVEAYQAALGMGLKLIHVPVRRTMEGYLWAVQHYQLGNYNYRYTSDQTINTDLKMIHNFWTIPAGDPTINPANGDVNFADQGGWFGFKMRDTRGSVLLSDVLALTQRKAVLYLQVRDIGSLSSDAPLPLFTYAYLQEQIRHFGVQQSVIVGSELPGNADRSGIVTALQTLRTDDNVVIAAHISSSAMATANPPATLVAEGFTWVMIDVAIADATPATVTAYKTAGLNVMLTGVHRQFEFNLSRSLALRGVLATDPVYAAGALAFYKYRRGVSMWSWPTPDYGRYAYGTTQEYMRDKYRGYSLSGALAIDGTTKGPHETNPAFRQASYMILMGEQCPIRDTRVAPDAAGSPNFYDIEFGVSWDALITDTGRHMGVFFGCVDDRPKVEYTLSNQYTKGYLFALSQNGQMAFVRYDGIPYGGSGNPFQFDDAWASGWGTITPGVEYRLKVRVRPDRIIVGRADQAEGGANTRTYTGANGTMWRGPYFYLTRHFFTDADSTRVRWHNLILTEGTSV